MSKTFDLSSKDWGNNYNVMSITDSGYKLSLVGWKSGISNGDYLILKNGNDTTRYVVEDISYFGDPVDMWKAEVSFSPR